MMRAAMTFLAELSSNFSASHTSSNAADMALIWCGSKTLSRKRIPSGKNGTIEPIYRHPFFVVAQRLTAFRGCSSDFCGTFAMGLRLGGTRAGPPDLLQRNGKSGKRAIMSKEREYRAYAAACVDLANKATNDDDRKHLLAMTEAWLGLADRVQRGVLEPTRICYIPRFGQSSAHIVISAGADAGFLPFPVER